MGVTTACCYYYCLNSTKIFMVPSFLCILSLYKNRNYPNSSHMIIDLPLSLDLVSNTNSTRVPSMLGAAQSKDATNISFSGGT